MRRMFFLALLMLAAAPAAAQELKVARLGDFKLESGEVIRDCRIGFRTVGTLDPQRSNAVLLTTWAGGTSEQMASSVGPGRLVDPAKHFVVIVDALGNGVSSSPSNSPLQPRMRFPKFSVRDMVAAQHEVLTKTLGVLRLEAVIGISMGGMQAFEWAVAYPDFVKRVIPIVGSPRLASYDLLHWQTQLDAITNDPAWNKGDYVANPARTAEAQFGMMLLTTPDEFNRRVPREKVADEIATAKKDSTFDANDKIRQTQAMMALDVSKGFGGSMERAAAAVKARVLVVVATRDHVVTPGPARDFARLLKASILELDGDCGHLAPGCEAARLNAAVADFLAK